MKKIKESFSTIVNKITKMTKKQVIVFVTIIIVIIGGATATYYTVEYFQKENVKKNSSVDFKNPTYEGKKIIVEKDKIIIIEENGSKTIETIGDKNSKYKKATEEMQKGYSFNSTKIEKNIAKTVVTGKIKNENSKYTIAIINIKFFKDNELQGSSSVIVEGLKKGIEKEFHLETLGDFSSFNYQTVIEYVG